jgi:uncharacterized repeat protein (TIGR01451 family)
MDTGSGYNKINENIVSDTEYFDSILAVQGETQYYRISAIDVYGNESDLSDSAGAANIIINKYINSVKLGGNISGVCPGATLEFFIEYTNNGFAPAVNSIFTDTVQVSTLFYKNADPAGIETGIGATVIFSNDNCTSWSYSPSGVVDSNVTNVRWIFNDYIVPTSSGVTGILKFYAVVR